jgi:hypothetical protein
MSHTSRTDLFEGFCCPARDIRLSDVDAVSAVIVGEACCPRYWRWCADVLEIKLRAGVQVSENTYLTAFTPAVALLQLSASHRRPSTVVQNCDCAILHEFFCSLFSFFCRIYPHAHPRALDIRDGLKSPYPRPPTDAYPTNSNPRGTR